MGLTMENSIYFIINPVAGNGRSLRVFKKIKAEMEKKNMEYRSFMTDYAGHAEVLARQIASIHDYRLKTVIGIGGDGTIHEIVNGLSGFDHIKIGYIASGSGNDFKRGYGSSKGKGSVLTKLNRQAKSYDLGCCRAGKADRLFVNSIGAGFDAYVAKLSSEMKWKKILNRAGAGSFVYTLALMKGLFTYQPGLLSVTIDGEEKVFEKVWLAAVSNHPYYGGGMKISPDARPDDGLLNATVVHGLSRGKLLLLFVLVFTGRHKGLKEVSMMEGHEITISGPVSVMVHADGEYLGETPVTVTLRPKSIKYYI